MAPLPVLSLHDVAGHNRKDDCWFVIRGKVYDVTEFLEEHPGGDDVLVEASGRDATTEFDDVGHSDHAKSMLKTYCVGVLEGHEAELEAPDEETEGEVHEIPSTKAQPKSYSPPAKVETQSSILSSLFRFVIPLFILGAAFAIRYFRGNEKEELST